MAAMPGRTGPAAAPLRQGAERLAGPLPALQVAAERVAATVAQGLHGRRRTGQGEAFWQFRPYETGDRLQQIDWRQSAKSDRLYVREQEWEAAQSLWLWCDPSGSMDWTSDARHLPTKQARANLLAMALACLLLKAGERVALLESPRPPATGRAALSRLCLELEQQQASTGPAAEDLPHDPRVPRYARLLLFGDFLKIDDQVHARLRRYAENGIQGHLVQILDPAELAFPYQGRIRFRGLEGEPSWLVNRSESLRADYLHALEKQRARLADAARSLGWSYSLHSTGSSAEQQLLMLYQGLSDGSGSAPGGF